MSTIKHLKVVASLRLGVILLSTLLLSAFSVTAQTLSTGWLTHADHPPAQVRFMLTGDVDKSNQRVKALLEVKLDGEWKTYWHSPGEGAISPSLDWSKSQNLTELIWHWPTPAYYEQSGIMTLGYKDHVIFPMELTVSDLNQPLVFSGKLTLPTCTNICVLTDYDLTIDALVPASLNIDTQTQHLYQKGLSRVPVSSESTRVLTTSFDKASQQLQVTLLNENGWAQPQVLISGDDLTDDYFSPPSLSITDNVLTATYTVTNWLGDSDLTGKSLSITISDELFAHELRSKIDDKPFDTSGSSNLLTMIGVALLGGLILNIMPCVLPILGMKLNSMMACSQQSKRTIRLQFIASALGILSSFWLLAAALFILKVTGNAIGWGIQFQSPLFIGLMVTVTALFTANLLGLFDIQLPSRFSTAIASKGGDSIFGHFAQGMFATLLATPCSAPFLGSAVAFALGASLFEMWVIFSFLGLGMALPWLLFALFPNLISMMPKPGAWMNRVKLLFGLMMLLTTLWLLSLLTSFIGLLASLVIGLLFCGFLLYRIGKKQGKKTVIAILAVVVFASSATLVIGSVTSEHWVTPIEDNLVWQPLNTQAIDEYVKQGKTVFVDVTADWCITCKANKIGVILQDPVYPALLQQNVVVMKGDWTRPSKRITQYLKSHQRYGVPLNVVYGPNAPQGLPLSVILTDKNVMTAIEYAGGTQ
ncbi:MAG: thioredoxin family protein [Aliivibrio sp.]|uniref:protein-disulfide reductase DsbD family protein n=1 Tax=Aliivibrio sp. TaxID=1872443 RepID=UPI001A550D6F|nr:thioredoxin family protein [Aliivibrio sp.]